MMQKFRVDRKLSLTEMSARLRCSHGYLCNIEGGNKAVPSMLVERIIALLELDAATAERLIVAAVKQARSVKIQLNHRSYSAKRLALVFADRFESMSEADIEAHLNWLQTNIGEPACSNPSTLTPKILLTGQKRLLKLRKRSVEAAVNTLPQNDSVQ